MGDADPSATLPFFRRPRPLEGLHGVLSVQDDENGFPSGVAATGVSRVRTNGPQPLGSPQLQFLATSFDLERLAELLGVGVDVVEATTLRRQLIAMFGPGVSARAVGPPAPFRVCRDCVGRRRFIGILTALPLVEMCPKHEIALATACANPDCGRPLLVFSAAQQPFSCRCGWPWSRGERRRLPPEEALAQRRIARAYRAILDDPPPSLREVGRRLARPAAIRWAGGFESPRWLPPYGQTVAAAGTLAGVVALLVRHGLHPDALHELARAEGGETAFACRAATCDGGAATIRSNGMRAGQKERYCARCGSRYLGDRMVQSFDLDNGDPRLRLSSVRRARARLLSYRLAIAAVLEGLPAGERALTAEEVLRRAGVPRSANLRAERLGLVALASAGLEARGVQRWTRQGTSFARWRRPSAVDAQTPFDAEPLVLADSNWALIRDILDPPRSGRPSRYAKREMFDAIVYAAATGCGWGHLPARFPPSQAVRIQWRRWRDSGAWHRALARLGGQYRGLEEATGSRHGRTRRSRVVG